MKRRTVLKSTAAAMAAPAIARADGPKTVRFVPHADLASIDPVWTTADVTRNYSLAVFDTLYAYDAQFNVQKQMVDGHVTEDDGKTVGEKSMIKDLLAGHETIIRRLRKEADLVGDKFHDVGTNDFITGVIEAHEKMAWMLRSYLA